MSETSSEMMVPGDSERQRRQRTRSLAIGLGLGFLVILFYVATIVRLGPNALRREGEPGVSSAKVLADDKALACKKAGTCP